MATAQRGRVAYTGLVPRDSETEANPTKSETRQITHNNNKGEEERGGGQQTRWTDRHTDTQTHT